MALTSADDNAQAASDAQAALPVSRAQAAWDKRSYAVSEAIKELRSLTTLGVHWSRNPERLATVDALLSDAMREVRALVCEGYREGSPGPAMPTLKPVAIRVAGQPDRIIPLLKMDAPKGDGQ